MRFLKVPLSNGLTTVISDASISHIIEKKDHAVIVMNNTVRLATSLETGRNLVTVLAPIEVNWERVPAQGTGSFQSFAEPDYDEFDN